MKWEDRFTEWYDRQAWETLILLGMSPLIIIGVGLIFVAVIFG